MTHAKNRTVRPEDFAGPDVQELSIEARYLLLALRCVADDRGCLIRADQALVAFAAGEVPFDARPALDELGQAGIIKTFIPDDHRKPALAIRNFMPSQRLYKSYVRVPMPTDAEDAREILEHVGWFDHLRNRPQAEILISPGARGRFPEVLARQSAGAKDKNIVTPAGAPPPLALEPTPGPSTGTGASAGTGMGQGADNTDAPITSLSVKRLESILSSDLITRIGTLWNTICGSEEVRLAQVLKMTDARKTALRSLARKYPGLKHERAWAWHFLRVAATAKLVEGISDPKKTDTTPWRADFDFCIKESNVVKIHEGRYGPASVSRSKLDAYELSHINGRRFIVEIGNPDSVVWNAHQQEGALA